MGYTLNQITMLALTLMVGVVIDDAIIVLENIYRFIEEKGMAPFEAAIEGTREIGLAVMATTLSLMAVFVPVGFMGGIVGRFMSSFGLTAAFAVGVSLIVSFTLTPMLCSRLIKIQPRRRRRAHELEGSAVFRPIDRAYMAMLRWSMAHRGRRRRWCACSSSPASFRCSWWSARTSCPTTTGPSSRSACKTRRLRSGRDAHGARARGG